MPSTIEIKHELRLMAAADAVMQSTSADDLRLVVQDLSSKFGLSPDRARMLVERFAQGRLAPADAGRELRPS